MKFNFFLLLLTTLTAVALSETIPPQYQIQLVENPSLFWALNGTNVVLAEQGIWWVIEPYAKGSFIFPVDNSGKSVQYNGVNEPLTIAHGEDLSHRWIFIGSGPNVIHSSQDPSTDVTYDEKGNVVAKYPIGLLTRWNLIRKLYR